MYSAYKLNKQGENIQPWHTPFPILNQSDVHVWFYCCFLTCIQNSQEAGKMVWYSHFFKNFPQFVVIYTVKSFSVVCEADVFLKFPCFFCDPVDIGNLILGSPAFLNPAWTSESFRFTYCWSLAWRILSITLLECEMSATVQWFEHSLVQTWFILWYCPSLGL